MQRNKIEQEFLENYDKHAGNILKHIYFRVNNKSLAEDMTQETFFKAWDYVVGNGKKINNLKTFTYRIAHNLIVDHYRRKPRLPISIETINAEEMASEPPQEKQIDRIIRSDLMKKALAELEEPYRQMISHRYIDDLSIKEIGEITGKSENNISVMIHRATKILKEKIYHEQQGNENN